MVNDIETLILDFQNSVKEVVQLFYEEYQRKDLLEAWYHGVYPQVGQFGSVMKRYFFHGIGLAVTLEDKVVDFDFGPNDRIDGFDAWRLFNFANSQAKYAGVWTKEAIHKELDKLMIEQKIYQPEDYGNYYYR
jgi:hypothetical protein